MDNDFDTALNDFLAYCQAMINDHFAKRLPNLEPDVLSIDPRGRKYVRIVRAGANGTSRSVYCFVNRENGDVLKAASWKAPAQYARGTVYGPPEGYGVTVYGGEYLS